MELQLQGQLRVLNAIRAYGFVEVVAGEQCVLFTRRALLSATKDFADVVDHRLLTKCLKQNPAVVLDSLDGGCVLAVALPLFFGGRLR